MGIAEQLNALRADFPACRVATFADLSSGLVLFASAASRMPQERLDALSGRARALLAGPSAEAGAALLGAPVGHAVGSDGEALLVLVRSPAEPDEALICHCDADIDIAAFKARAAGELAALGAGT
jgi:hypothetical protein